MAEECLEWEKLRPVFAQAVFDVFTTMAGIEPQQKACAKTRDKADTAAGTEKLTGAMLIPGKKNALLTLTMAAEPAYCVVAAMTGTDSARIVPAELYDGLGELVNMIAGRAKALLAGTDLYFQLSAPLVIAGGDHKLIFKHKTAQFRLHYDMDGAEIELCFSYL